MSNISLVISGNLTGFSRFYASSAANDILNEVKFDFDYRNYLAFLSGGDKAYAISFAPSVIAVSLVTRILDSFRRPGILVVSLLLPRKSRVESALNSQNKYALYQLLNEINDKFYEKNFVNGMVNQNAAVLMQDYYSEILGNYILVSDEMQRNINATIEVTSSNKRLGYVQTIEDNVPLYLSSPCRRSYEGSHHIFFAKNPNQNLIPEEPVEVVFYRVHITNNNQSIPSVTLNDRVYNLQPDEGEIDIDKNFTYRQVLNGEAGRAIVADLRGETIEMTYRFGLEEKTIRFIFNETGKVIPFTDIMPVLEFDDTFINIPSETYTFQGKEIYGSKRLRSRGTDYRIRRESELLDLRRLQDTCIVQVEHCFSIRMYFNQPEDRPKRITFKSNSGEFPFANVTTRLEAILPGYREDYSYVIESPYYERETGYLTPSESQGQFPKLRPVRRSVPQSHQGGLMTSDVPISTREEQPATTVYSSRNEVRPVSSYARSTGNQQGGALQLSGGGDEIQQQRSTKPKFNKYIKFIPYVAAVLCIGIACLVLSLFPDVWPNLDEEGNADKGQPTEYEQLIRVYFVDASGDPLKWADFSESGDDSVNEFNRLVDVVLQNELGDKIESHKSASYSDSIEYMYKLKVLYEKDNNYSFQIKTKSLNLDGGVSDGILIGSSEMNFNVRKSKEVDVYDIPIKLLVKTSELRAYERTLDYTTRNANDLTSEEKKEIEKIKRIAKSLLYAGRCSALGQLILEIISPVEKAIVNEEAKETVRKNVEEKTSQNILIDLNANLPEAIKGRIKRAASITSPSLLKDLTDSQKKVIDDYNNWLEKIYMGQKDKNQQNEIKDKYLSQYSTFIELRNVMNIFQGEK